MLADYFDCGLVPATLPGPRRRITELGAQHGRFFDRPARHVGTEKGREQPQAVELVALVGLGEDDRGEVAVFPVHVLYETQRIRPRRTDTKCFDSSHAHT